MCFFIPPLSPGLHAEKPFRCLFLTEKAGVLRFFTPFEGSRHPSRQTFSAVRPSRTGFCVTRFFRWALPLPCHSGCRRTQSGRQITDKAKKKGKPHRAFPAFFAAVFVCRLCRETVFVLQKNFRAEKTAERRNARTGITVLPFSRSPVAFVILACRPFLLLPPFFVFLPERPHSGSRLISAVIKTDRRGTHNEVPRRSDPIAKGRATMQDGQDTARPQKCGHTPSRRRKEGGVRSFYRIIPVPSCGRLPAHRRPLPGGREADPCTCSRPRR